MRKSIQISRREIRVGPNVVYYQVAGNEQDEPIILVHGLSASSRWWIRNIPALAQRYRVYLLDLPGFGIMRRFRSRFVLDELATRIVAWMDAVGISRAHLMGHSMGGYICLRMAARYPERIQRLVLVAPAGIPHVHSVYGYTVPLLVAFRYFQPRFFSILLTDALRAGPLTILHAAQDLLTKDIRDALHDVKAPTLLVWGEHDSLVPPMFGPVLQQEIRDARLLILKKAGHVVMFDQAARFNEAVIGFLGGEGVG